MAVIQVDQSRQILLRNKKPYFYLADTVWMAFQKLSVEEWKNYLRLRSRQGFNAVQVSVLPIAHDNSIGENDLEPFVLDDDGNYQFGQINEEYFDKAEEMVKMAEEMGITSCLHLFWVNYIPQTWGAEKSPERVIPYERLKEIAAYMIKRFDSYHPIYSVSGDTKFETPEVIKYYQTVFDVLEELSPNAVSSMHLAPTADPPQELTNRSGYSFYSYQSSHSGTDFLKNISAFSDQFLSKSCKKPIINTEPCYEAIGYYDDPCRKFSAFEVRWALWTSVLSGASAGITYGAHGAWGCHKKGMRFKAKTVWGEAYDFQDAIRLRGAEDAAFLKAFMEEHRLMGMLPAQQLSETGHVQVGKKDNAIVVYAPFDCEIVLGKQLSEYEVKAVNVARKMNFSPEILFRNGKTIIAPNGSNEDAVYLFYQ